MRRHRDPDWMISWSIFGELTQSLCPAFSGPSHFYLSAFESELSTLSNKNACPLSWEGIVIRIGFKPMTYCLAYRYGFHRSCCTGFGVWTITSPLQVYHV